LCEETARFDPRLADGGRLELAPGVYRVELHCPVVSGAVTEARLQLNVAGSASQVALEPVGPARWRSRIELASSAQLELLSIAGRGACILPPDVLIEDHALEEPPAPSIVLGLITLLRALFRALPPALRSAVLNSPFLRRRIAAARRRAVAQANAADQANAGRVMRAPAPAEPSDFETRFATARNIRDPRFIGESAPPLATVPKVDLVAFYLPQFHPIPENDAWWGRGFTEWTNVAKAVPQFEGHYQPRLPGELGFYDLRLPETLLSQADLARAYGVKAFAFHYYWFAGKRVLERPLDLFLARSDIDLKFCLCWANENWTRRWDGDESQVLLAQRHSAEDYAAIFADMARYIEDRRYLRIDGKPLIIVYRADLIPDPREMLRIWREEAAARGWPGLHVVATNAFGFNPAPKLGFDACLQYPPHGLALTRVNGLRVFNQKYRGEIFSYEAAAEEAIRQLAARRTNSAFDFYPGVMPGWDNEARRPGAGAVYHGATPAFYERWLRAAVEHSARTLPAGRRLVFVNAWNEWAEGAHLEPDQKYGRAFLAATARALEANAAALPRDRLTA
jgi:hypothetical protein